MGFWREAYNFLGWDYYDKWDDRQRYLKYMTCLQIQNGYITKLLPPMKMVTYKKKKNRK